MYRKTITVAEAQELAKAGDIPGLEEAVAQALAASWDAMTIIAEQNAQGTYDVVMEAPTGVMVGWFLPRSVAERVHLVGGEPVEDLHVTLAYFGDVDSLSLDDQRKLVGIVGEVVVSRRALVGQLKGVNAFPPAEGEDVYPLYVGVDVPGLGEIHKAIVDAATEAGIEVSTFDTFTPHVTVAYLSTDTEPPALDFAGLDIVIDQLTVAVGPQRLVMDLQNDDAWGPEESNREGWVPMTKALDTEKPERYTLGPMYVPDQLDAHGDWTDSKELQKAVWDYHDAGDFRIRLQHHTDIVAGRCVELLSWPYEVTVPLTKADGTTVNYTYPPGTPFMGTIWEEWAWELIEKGELNGYSIGGKADMIEVDLGSDPLAKAKGCIEWDGYRNEKGYGVKSVNGTNVKAHRWAWEQANGPIPEGKVLLHSCDNPPCINVKHLSVGTVADNNQDRADKGR